MTAWCGKYATQTGSSCLSAQFYVLAVALELSCHTMKAVACSHLTFCTMSSVYPGRARSYSFGISFFQSHDTEYLPASLIYWNSLMPFLRGVVSHSYCFWAPKFFNHIFVILDYSCVIVCGHCKCTCPYSFLLCDCYVKKDPCQKKMLIQQVFVFSWLCALTFSVNKITSVLELHLLYSQNNRDHCQQ